MQERLSYRFLPLLCFLVVAPVIAAAQDTGLQFDELWSHRTGSASYGGVRADARRVYAGTEDGILRALDKTNGRADWTFDAGAAIASNIAYDDLRVYFHTRAGIVFALDRNSGAELWRTATQGERRWDYWDYYLSTPAVDDRQVYFGSGDHHVYALDKRTGQLRWKVRVGNIVHGEPVIAGEKIIIGGFDGRMHAIDRGTGRIVWSFKTVGNAYFRNGEIPGSATALDGFVYFGGRDYNIYALLEDTGTGAWNDRTPSWIVGRPLALEDELIVVNSDGATVFSYDRRTGQRNWEFSNSYNMFAAAEAIGTAHVAVAGLDGRITILSRADGTRAGHYETSGAVENRSRFFTDAGRPDYTGLKTLEDLMERYDHQLDAMGGITGDIAVDGNVIYYATAGGEIAAIQVHGIELPED
jgi:outer membrane protein assembly factor BamB